MHVVAMNRGRGQRRSRRGTRAMMTQISNRISGFVPRGSFDPPSVIVNPWNSLVLCGTSASNDAGVSTVTLDNAHTLFCSQTGIALTQDISIRVLRVGVWGTGADAVLPTAGIALRPRAFISNSARQWIEDYGTTARVAHCHYVWPDADNQYVFQWSTQKNRVLYDVDHGAAFSWVNHIHILWKPVGGDPIPTSGIHRNRLDSNLITRFESIAM